MNLGLGERGVEALALARACMGRAVGHNGWIHASALSKKQEADQKIRQGKRNANPQCAIMGWAKPSQAMPGQPYLIAVADVVEGVGKGLRDGMAFPHDGGLVGGPGANGAGTCWKESPPKKGTTCGGKG